MSLDGKIISHNHDGMNITFDMSDLAEALKQMEKETRYHAKQIVFFGAKVFTERAQRQTPLARKKVKTYWWWDKDDEKWIKLDKPRTCEVGRGRGFARQGWREIRGKLGAVSRGSSFWTGGDVKRLNWMKDGRRSTRDNPFIAFANQIPYIMNLDARSNILKVATHNTTVKIMQQLTRTIRKEARKWR